MDERTVGLVLRTHPLTETSLIVQWLTPVHGRLSTVAKGARRPKSPFAGKLDLFYLADFSFQPSRRSQLHALREVKVQSFNPAIRVNLGYLQQASYFAQLIEQTTEPQTPLPGLFELTASAIEALPLSHARSLTVYAFELKLLTEMGLSPDLAQGGLAAGTREIAQRLVTADWPLLARLQPSRVQDDELGAFLSQFLAYHCGRVPRGRAHAVRPG